MEALPNGIWRVQLPNGHRIVAYCARKMRAHAAVLKPGDRVTVEMSPFDMSKGCMTDRKQTT